jgi:DNA-binding IclR family transcriptional regulator
VNRTKYALCNANDFKVLDYIWKFHGENKNNPPVSLIGENVGISNSYVYDCLAKLQKHGYIDLIKVTPHKRYIVPLWKK